MKLALDHHFSPAIAMALRAHGLDVITLLERGWQGDDDESVLTSCALEHRALLTQDVRDFMLIVRDWQASGQSHAGLVLASSQARLTHRDQIGTAVSALHDLMKHYLADNALNDRVIWLARD